MCITNNYTDKQICIRSYGILTNIENNTRPKPKIYIVAITKNAVSTKMEIDACQTLNQTRRSCVTANLAVNLQSADHCTTKSLAYEYISTYRYMCPENSISIYPADAPQRF